MMAEGPPPLGCLEDSTVRWLMDRFDAWRSSIASRASIVLSADAILLAGTTFVVDKIMADRSIFHSQTIMGLQIAISICVLLLMLSLWEATMGIANVWSTSRRMFGPGMPSRWPYHPSDVLKRAESYPQFEEAIRGLTQPDLSKAEVSELWSLACMHHARYQSLRWSIRFLILALPLYVLVVLALVLELTL